MAPEITPAGRRLVLVPENRFQWTEEALVVPAAADDADTWGLDAGMAPEVEFRRTGRGVAPADMSHSVKTGWLVVGSVRTMVKLGKLLEADLE